MNNSTKQLMAIVGGVLIFIFLFSLCNPFQREIQLLDDPQIDYFIQNEAASKVDILWVVDNSGSMQSSQNNLAENFREFIRRFVDENSDEMIDFQMAVVTTDILQEDGRFVDGKILDRSNALADREVFIREFQDLVRVGTDGLGLECSLMPMLRATQHGDQQRFFREDAILVVNILSDEADMSEFFEQKIDHLLRNGHDADIPGHSYASFASEAPSYDLHIPNEDMSDQNVEDFVKAIKSFKDGRRVMINSIVSMNGRVNGMSTRGEEQMKASRMTNGIIADIRSDFADVLGNMGENIYKLAHSFALSRKADSDERMIVFVDGYEIEDWEYNPQYQTIEFINGYVPEAGSEIEVHYEVFREYEGE